MDLKAMGLRLQTARKAARLTQQVAATKVGIDLSSLSRYERALVEDISMKTVTTLAELYGARLDWIVYGTGPMSSEQAETTTDRDTSTVEALRVFLAGFEPDDPHRPTADEASRLRGISFRELRLAGLEITPSLYGRVLREMRLQDQGRIARGEAERVDVDDSTMDLPEPRKRGR
jgi:transcriptional regulator with XRE-family HTH domain